jgi:uncharacterized protein (TIGR00730 family)
MNFSKNIIFFSITLIFLFGCNPKDAITITLTPDMCKIMGRNLANGEIPTPKDLAKDVYCAEQLIKEEAPNGVITIFGSSRAKEDWQSYKDTRKFAHDWTKAYGDKFPILSGGGPGIMEAGNRGAKEAGGKSLSFATYFGSGAEKENEYVTKGFLFASFSQREADMVDRAAAIIIAPGGVGTEWEIFETLAKIQTKKKHSCPVILLGKKKIWKTLYDRMNWLKKMKTISPKNIDILSIAETPEEAIAIIKKAIIKK